MARDPRRLRGKKYDSEEKSTNESVKVRLRGKSKIARKNVRLRGKKVRQRGKVKNVTCKGAKRNKQGFIGYTRGYKEEHTRIRRQNTRYNHKKGTRQCNTYLFPRSFSLWNPKWRSLRTGLHFGFLRRKDPENEIKHFFISRLTGVYLAEQEMRDIER